METMLPRDVQKGLDQARRTSIAKASRLRIDADGATHKVLRLWKTGFSVDADTAPQLRGLVDLYDGGNHLFQCLIVAGDEDDGEMRFEFKRATRVHTTAPVDFERAASAPAGLIADQR